ncbi:MAG: signal recognition particle-docking protein FtsY [Propionibacteriaceae bacterium]|nr:signal recognition particle-docking protein FtsY [Propionibacteriaceae bacterium]
MFFWYLMAGILLAVIIATVIVVVSNIRHRRAVARGDAGLAVVEAPPEDVGAAPAQTEILPPSTGEPGEVPPPETAPAVQTPELPSTRFARLRRRLASSNNALARGLADLLASDKISAETWEDFEATLISSDLGVGPTTELVAKLKSRLSIDGVSDPEQAKAILREELVALVDPSMDRDLHLDTDEPPAVIMVVGVNGTGKTTTVGKLARDLVASDKSVLLGAADTFRAAAADQLTTWGERIGVETVRGAEGADPASVAFDAVRTGRERGVDIVLVDTAGRLHNKTNLMDELGKVKRVIEKIAPVKETLLVLDATTGQNGLVQARVFAEVAQITGIVLTKLDGSAKGGIVVAVQRELGVPVKFIGLGEGADDLAGFDAGQFVDGLLGQ